MAAEQTLDRIGEEDAARDAGRGAERTLQKAAPARRLLRLAAPRAALLRRETALLG